ncbi:MAG: hypothetical protein ABGW78_00360 [Pirellulales bacterium]
MDPHFNEYLSAVRCMQEFYGETTEDVPSEFQQEQVVERPEVVVS